MMPLNSKLVRIRISMQKTNSKGQTGRNSLDSKTNSVRRNLLLKMRKQIIVARCEQRLDSVDGDCCTERRRTGQCAIDRTQARPFITVRRSPPEATCTDHISQLKSTSMAPTKTKKNSVNSRSCLSRKKNKKKFKNQFKKTTKKNSFLFVFLCSLAFCLV